MSSHVLFVVLEGAVTVKVNDDEARLEPHQCLITPPAVISMQTDQGVRMLGIQIEPD